MIETVAFPLDDGGELLVRIEEPSPPSSASSPGPAGVVTRGGGATAQQLERAERTFEAALGTIQVVAGGVLRQLTTLARSPDEVQVQFGVELSAKAGAILAAAGTKAHLQVSLTWKPDRDVPAQWPGQLAEAQVSEVHAPDVEVSEAQDWGAQQVGAEEPVARR
jgi:hypothetical protein